MNKTLCSLFGLLTVTFVFLAFGVRNETIDQIGGWFGVATASNALWLAYVELVNDMLGKGSEIIPLGHWKWVTEKKIAQDHAVWKATEEQGAGTDGLSV
jgi:succinate-acetate transporter protein